MSPTESLPSGRGERSRDVWFRRLGAPLAAGLIRLLAATMRLEFEGESERLFNEALDARRPVLFVFWHEDLFGVAALHLQRNWRRPEGKRGAVMISQSRDGEMLAQVISHLGMETVRGSSTRGGLRGLIGFVHWLRADSERPGFGAIALDGPRGPRHVAKPGAALLAKHADAQVYQVSFTYSRAWTFRSWDRTKLGKPWARMTCRIVSGLAE